MSSLGTGTLLKNGEEPTELLRQLAFEYLAALNRSGQCEFLEADGKDGVTVLLAVIPNACIEGPKIVDCFKPTVPTIVAEEKTDEVPA